MKDLILKFKALFFTFIVLFSSSFVLVEDHYCCGELIDFSLFGNADVCDMDMPTCELGDINKTVSEDTCCSSNKQFKMGGIFKFNPGSNQAFQQLVVVPMNYQYTTNLNVSLTSKQQNYKDYRPPLITRDILVIVQRFLI